ncbi:MAG: hypothetical protein J1G07_03140 [Clostridiales bacterium]|nr:hypothetical protein [Clostridiales bacterium]
MNIFSSCGNNTCLWILILLLLTAGFTGSSLEDVLSGSCTPILLALIYSMWKNGTLSRMLCGNCGNNN